MNFLTSLISPNSGKSHKRVVSLVAAATIIGGFIADIFADIHVDAVLVDAVMWLALIGMGTSVLERFAPSARKGHTSTMETKTTIVEAAPEEKP
jgi:hypothetical protein